MNFIATPFASFMLVLYNAFLNYGWAILAFGLVVKLIMLPFQMKSKHSLMRTTMLQPRLKELEKKYATNKQKYQEEVTKLYKDAKVNPMSGCLWTLIPFPILIALYGVVRQPLVKLMGLSADQISILTQKLVDMGLYEIPARANAYAEMTLANIVHENFAAVSAALPDMNLLNINFDFLGMTLTDQPRLFFWNFFDEYGVVAAIILFLLPFVSAFLTWLQSKLTQAMQPAAPPQPGTTDAQAAQTAKTMQSMNIMMPIMSVYICFIMPAAMGLYWIEQSVLGIIQEYFLNRYYKKKLDTEMEVFNAEQRKRDEELERKRQETERLKAEGKTQVNTSTSKKRLAAQEKNAEDLRRAAERAAERAAKGLVKETPASQVGSRRYARGRAYVADRYASEALPVQESQDAGEQTEE